MKTGAKQSLPHKYFLKQPVHKILLYFNKKPVLTQIHVIYKFSESKTEEY